MTTEQKQATPEPVLMPVLLVGGRFDGRDLSLPPHTQMIDIAPDKNVIVPEGMAAERDADSARYYIYPIQVPSVDYPLVYFVGVIEGKSLAWAMANLMAFYSHKHAENKQENLH